MEVRAIIVDDEPLARDVIKVWIEPQDQIEIVDECENGKQAIESIRAHKPNLVFLDIQMPDIDGFGVVKALKDDLPNIIFITAYDEYALSAFDINAIDYLLKPFNEDRFKKALKRALEYIHLQEKSQLQNRINKLLNDYDEITQIDKQPSRYITQITVKDKNKIMLINTKDIEWIEAAGDYVALHHNGRKPLMNESMNKMESQLDPSKFMRIHRSAIVNIEKIKHLEPYFNGEFYLVLSDGTKVKSSRRYKHKILSVFQTK